MKKASFCALLLLVTFYAAATRVATFPDLMDPKHLLLDGDKLYISDYPSIYIIKLSDYSLMKKFGKKGHGPGEFFIDQESMNSRMRGLMISLQPERLLVKNETRLSFFSLSGQFRGEKRLYGRAFNVQSIGDRFVGQMDDMVGDKELFATLQRFNSDLKPEKTIYRCSHWWRGMEGGCDFFERASDSIIYRINGDTIYLVRGGSQEFQIEVCDSDGNSVRSIKLPVEKIKIDAAYKKSVHRYFKIKFQLGVEWNIKNTSFPEFFPAIRDFTVDGDRIYAFTYRRDGALNEVKILDLQGILLKTVMLEIAEQNPEHFFPYAVSNGVLYQLVENEDSEDWELFSKNMDPDR